jgi:alpha-tubulin suppressor-like RCC1 family protein
MLLRVHFERKSRSRGLTVGVVYLTHTYQVACGSGSDIFFALTTAAEILSWGTDEALLGREVTPSTPANKPSPVRMDFLAADICAGSTHALALSTDFHVYSWGIGKSGNLIYLFNFCRIAFNNFFIN